jgi:protein-disulfide isomerase
MPVPVWGIWAYGFFCLVTGFAAPGTSDRRRLWTLLMLTALGFSIYGCVLAVISTFYIHSYCIMCIASYAINFLLLFYTWMVRRRFGAEPLLRALKQDFQYLRHKKRRALGAFLPYATAFFLVWAFFLVYWTFSAPVLVQQVPTGVSEDGYPWVGAEDPELVITEFTDYLCFQCNKMHFYLRKLMSRYPGKIRLVHRHFPMDHTVNPIVQTPVHQKSGVLALVALYAETRGKFWPVSDFIFSTARATGKLDLKAVSEILWLSSKDVAAGIRDSKVRQRLQKDLIDGLKLGVSGTPTYVIDGRLYLGQIPADIIAEALEQ